MITKFLHTGLRVNDLNQAIAMYESIGFEIKTQFDKPEPNAKAAQVVGNGTCIELWEFIDTEHPQVEFISRHLAFESDDFESDIAALVDQGCELVIPRTKGVTRTYAFVRDTSGNYLEICEVKNE